MIDKQEMLPFYMYMLSLVAWTLISASYFSMLKVPHIVSGIYPLCYSAVSNCPLISVNSVGNSTHHSERSCNSAVLIYATIRAFSSEFCEHAFS